MFYATSKPENVEYLHRPTMTDPYSEAPIQTWSFLFNFSIAVFPEIK